MTSSQGTKYILVMVEHLSKWIKLVACVQNSLELAALAFLECVLSRFGALVEVHINQGKEFLRFFEEL